MKKKTILVNFGNAIRKHRIENKLTQKALAKKANLHRTYIGMIERAEKNITLFNIAKLAKSLKIEIRDLFTAKKGVARQKNNKE